MLWLIEVSIVLPYTYHCSNGVICYNPVMKLREALDKLNRVKGITHAEQGACGSAEEEWMKYEFQYT